LGEGGEAQRKTIKSSIGTPSPSDGTEGCPKRKLCGRSNRQR
jgi:hypothetical protein